MTWHKLTRGVKCAFGTLVICPAFCRLQIRHSCLNEERKWRKYAIFFKTSTGEFCDCRLNPSCNSKEARVCTRVSDLDAATSHYLMITSISAFPPGFFANIAHRQSNKDRPECLFSRAWVEDKPYNNMSSGEQPWHVVIRPVRKKWGALLIYCRQDQEPSLADMVSHNEYCSFIMNHCKRFSQFLFYVLPLRAGVIKVSRLWRLGSLHPTLPFTYDFGLRFASA